METKTGRPTKFNAEAAAIVLDYIKAGCPRETAAHAAGLGRTTLMRWLARGRKESEGEFRDFWHSIKKAEAEAVLEHVQRINKASEKSWQAAAWWLERMHPDEFGSERRTIRELKKLLVEVTSKKSEYCGLVELPARVPIPED